MKIITYVLLFLLFSANLTFAQQEILKPEVKKPVFFDVSPPLRDMAAMPVTSGDNSWKNGVVKNFFNARKNHNRPTFPSKYVDPAIQPSMGTSVTTDTTLQNFEGNSNTQGYDPPDTHGDVSANYYFQVVNCHYSIYNKTGTVLLGPLNTSTIWNGMSNNSNDGDAVVIYDEIADRWLISQFSLPNYPAGPFYQMIAVSTTNNPTGSWYRWQYTFTDMDDYPKFGVWPDGYYMTCNRFTAGAGNYAGTGQAAFNRTKMLVGDATAEMIYFTLPASNNAWALLPSDCDGTFPPAGTPNYFVYMMDSPYYLGVYEFHADWTTTSNSTFGNYLQLTVNSFNSSLSGIPQKGTTRKADALSDRLMYRLQFRKFSDHWAMVTNHTVNAGSNIGGIRWYELRKTTGAWSVYQQSTFSPDATSRWMGSIALDTAGNMALGYSISSSTMYPSIKYTGRMKNDALNTMTIAERGIFNGTGSNTVNDGGGVCRWGDYSAISVDPSANATYWYTQQYIVTNGSNWHTRIASFSWSTLFTVSASATPAYINIGQTSQLNVVATGGIGTYTYSWTSLPAGYNSNIQNPVVSPILTTKYIAHVVSGTQTKTDTTTVYVNMNIIATATPYTINGGQNSQLNVSVSGGTGTYAYSWTSNPAGFTSNIQNPVVSPTITTIYTANITSGTQTGSDTAKVNVNMSILATATPPAIILGQSSQLDVNATGGSGNYTYSWTSIPAGYTSNIKNPVVSPTVTTQYVAHVGDGSQTKLDTAQVTVTLGTLTVIATASPSTICNGQTSQLNAAAAGGTLTYSYSWVSIPPGFTSNIANPMVTPLVTTQYIVTVSDGSSSVSDTTQVNVVQNPTAFAGNDTTYCVTISSISLNGSAANYTTVMWSTSGTGTFSNTNALVTAYYPSAADKTTGHVNLTLTAYPQTPCANATSSTDHILFDNCNGIPQTGNEPFGVTVSPNPTAGQFNLTITGLKNQETFITILDFQGKLIFSDRVYNNEPVYKRNLDFSNLAKGIYLIKVEKGSEEKTDKLLVQ
ncbi:MAG: T9SS type A sorting domain-containing protein [Bacteroidetes bacterium]|nr:T9SS type A sorting domain-containing protein [Bacteroidota bacterium]